MPSLGPRAVPEVTICSDIGHKRLCVYVCMYACMRTYIYVYTYMRIFISVEYMTNTHTSTYTMYIDIDIVKDTHILYTC